MLLVERKHVMAQHEAEIQNRQRVGAMLLQYSLQQQMINAANRPM